MGSVVHVVDPELADPASIAEAVAAIEAGGLVVLPTETVYGIACRPDDGAATARLFAAKRRPARLSLPVLTSSVPEAFELGIPTPGAATLAEAFWPGPLTMVLARTERSAPWRLGTDPATIGLRVPDHPVARSLLRATGPLAVTSANASGHPPAGSVDGLLDAFADAVAVYLVLAEPLPPDGHPPSTVVDLAHGRLGVVRQGAIAPADLDRILLGTGPQGDSVH